MTSYLCNSFNFYGSIFWPLIWIFVPKIKCRTLECDADFDYFTKTLNLPSKTTASVEIETVAKIRSQKVVQLKDKVHYSTVLCKSEIFTNCSLQKNTSCSRYNMTSLFFSKIAHTVTTRKFEILSKRRGHIITVFHKVILCTKWEFDYIEGLKQLLSHVPDVPTSCWQKKKTTKVTKNEKFTSIWRIFWTKIQNSIFANFSIQNLFRHPVCHKMRL